MKYKTTREMKKKSGEVIPAGTDVNVSFDVESRNGGKCMSYFSVNDGNTRIVTRDFAAVGIDTPSMEQLEEWASDSVCESVFGESVEPDGTDEHGSPSWLLALGLI